MLKSVDRVLKALHHEEPDMVPCLWAVASGLRRLQEALTRRGTKFPQDILGVESVLETEVIERGSDYELLRSPFGDVRRLSYKADYGYVELIKPAISKPEDIESVGPPTLSVERVKRIKRAVEENRDYFTIVGHDSSFGMAAHRLRGFKQFLVDIVRDPSFARRLLDFATEALIEMTKSIIEETGVNGVWLTGDLGDSKGPFMSPRLYREMIYPYDLKVVSAYHKLGAFVFLHSHGNLNSILDDLVRAGFDGLNPLDESENMDLAAIKEKYGDRITLIPQPSTYKLEKMSKNLIEKYVADQLHAGAHGGGFIYYGVLVNMPLENAEEYLRAFEKLRKYPLRCCAK